MFTTGSLLLGGAVTALCFALGWRSAARGASSVVARREFVLVEGGRAARVAAAVRERRR